MFVLVHEVRFVGSPSALFADLQLAPPSFGVGGFIGATIRGIGLMYAKRFHGHFFDATHFVVPAGRAQFVVDFTVDPDGPVEGVVVSIKGFAYCQASKKLERGTYIHAQRTRHARGRR